MVLLAEQTTDMRTLFSNPLQLHLVLKFEDFFNLKKVWVFPKLLYSKKLFLTLKNFGFAQYYYEKKKKVFSSDQFFCLNSDFNFSCQEFGKEKKRSFS